MTQLFKIIIQFLFWLQAFACPLFLFGLIALIVNKSSLVLPLLIAGAIVGVLVAEFIRKKYGLSIFFSRIYGPNEMDNAKKEPE